MKMSKSRYCRGVQCEKILWLEKTRPDLIVEGDESRLKTGQMVGELAKGLFGEYTDIPYDMDMEKRSEMTDRAIRDNAGVITEASFLWNDNFCSVDILKNYSGEVEIYEVKSSTKIKDIYIDDAAYQQYVLTNSGLNVRGVFIVHINNEYVRGENLEIDRLFTIEDVTSDCIEKQDGISDNIARFRQSNGHSQDIDRHCFEPYPCAFWEYCTRNLPKPNVFDIRGMQTRTKLKKYREGKISFEDLKNEKINPKYLEQIDFELAGRSPKINKSAIKDILDTLTSPLYFIDYETCQYAVPEFAGTKPYQQIPFQYSLHIIAEEGSSMEHREFLAQPDDEDMIRTFAERMIGDMPENGSVIVYNKAFESSRNREIGEMYPDLADEMERINSNIVDLMVPFKNRDYYMREMKGSYSIKYVLPALYPDDSQLNYANLPVVHNGGEASQAFLSLKDKIPSEQKKIREGLLRYCELDTLAMVKIWEKFLEVVE